jgi:hypothetical protein
VLLALIVTTGTVAFAHAYTGCPSNPSQPRPGCAMAVTTDAVQLPVFQPLVYTLDTVLPIVDLRQQEFGLLMRPSRGVGVCDLVLVFHRCRLGVNHCYGCRAHPGDRQNLTLIATRGYGMDPQLRTGSV